MTLRDLERRIYTLCVVFFSSRRRHTRFDCDWSSDVCSSDLAAINLQPTPDKQSLSRQMASWEIENSTYGEEGPGREHRPIPCRWQDQNPRQTDRKSTRLNSSHSQISYAVFCLKKKSTDMPRL